MDKFKYDVNVGNEYDLSGENVVCVMMDRGIDYFHPDFIDENGNTRDISEEDLARIRESARYCIRRAGVFESLSGETIGVVYQARKIAPKYSNQLCGTWRIVDHEMIMVTMQGEYSVHNKETLKEGDWDNPFGRSIECYLAGNPLPISKGLQILPR